MPNVILRSNAVVLWFCEFQKQGGIDLIIVSFLKTHWRWE